MTDMKTAVGVMVALGWLAGPASAQPTIASVMEQQISLLESQFVPAAEAMPESKYSFAPTSGEYKRVRTFALQVKHVAQANVVFYGSILGQPLPAGVNLAGAMNGPDDLQSKAQIVKYLKDSFALGHKALATLTLQNALVPVPKPLVRSIETPLALATFGCGHAWDHYGQIVEYLRMNGIVPPASQGQPAANPSTK